MKEKVATVQNFDNLSPEGKKMFIKAGLHYRDEYVRAVSETDGISAAAAFHNLIDETMEVKRDEYKISCGNHCGFCCYIHNEITEDEAQLLVEYAAEQKIDIDRELLSKQMHKSIDDYRTMKPADRKCVFLDNRMSCKVYEHRPGTCRKYQVVSEPYKCDLDRGIDDVLVVINNEVETIFSGMGLAAKKVGLMADMLIEKLNGQSTKAGTQEALV